jgi:predicted nucleotidyltransferase component of viral defense system
MTFTETQREEHELIMRTICERLAVEKKPLVLKGGTALKLCYELDRFSEDLDFDSAQPLNLEHFIENIFVTLGKSQAHLRKPQISLLKNTKTVKRYRVEYGASKSLKIETSMRGTPDENELVYINEILTYKMSALIKQKLAALQGRTTARDLHDVIFMFDRYFEEFDQEKTAAIIDLYASQSEVLNRFSPAYEEDTLLRVDDLLKDLMKLVELVDQRGLRSAH